MVFNQPHESPLLTVGALAFVAEETENRTAHLPYQEGESRFK